MQAAGVESREIEMEEDDSADCQQAAVNQQAEAPNFPPVEIKEDEEPVATSQQAVCLPT